MGRKITAECLECMEHFDVREGSGQSFYLLHCDTCGEEKTLPEQDVRQFIMENMVQLSDLTFQEKVETLAGRCKDGHFRLHANARCPKCKSDKYKMAKGSMIEYYD